MPRSLSINRAIEIAYTHRPSQESYDFAIQAAKNKQLAGLSVYFPHLDVQNRIGTVNQAVLLPEKQVFIEAKQLLLSFSAPERFRIARQETRIAIERKYYDQDNIRFDTEKSMLELWNTQEKETLIRSLKNSSVIVFDRDSNQHEIGLLDTNIWLQNVATFASSTAQVLQYENEINISLASIERSLGIPISDDISLNKIALENFIADSIACAQKYDECYYFQLALENRKDLAALDELIIREGYIADQYAKSYLPEVYLFGQVNYFNFKPFQRIQASPQGGGRNRWLDWRVGIEFDWRFDGLESAFNSDASRASQCAYEATRVDTEQQIKKDVYTKFNEMRSSVKELQAQEAKFKQADNEFTLKKIQHEIREISDVELAQAETNWQQAHFDLISLEKKIASEYRELLFKSGYPDTLS